MTQTPPEKVPLGQPISWSDEDLDAFTEGRDVDVKAALTFWFNNAPYRYKRLLQADAQEGDASSGRRSRTAF